MDDHMNMPGMHTTTAPASLGIITEYSLAWPTGLKGSTHELVLADEFIFVTGQNNNQVAKFNYNGTPIAYYNMPDTPPADLSEPGNLGSGPHGLLLDSQNRLWISLEFYGQVVRLNDEGRIEETIDVRMYTTGAKKPINTAPHGIGLTTDNDVDTIWFTGKRTSTIGRFNLNDKVVEHFELNTLAALPIFLHSGPGDGIWGTELYGSKILNISKSGVVKEYTIPTANSRPIAVIPDPSGKFMWFTEEAGVKIGKIDAAGTITEYPVPALQKNDILASLAFDDEYNLWVQVYVDINNPTPTGPDYIIKFDKSIRDIEGNDISGVPFVTHIIPSTMSMMHRIRKANDGNLWFTEMMTDKLGKIALG